MVAPGSSTEAEGPGRVGIGVNTTMMMQDTATLIVNGDTRVGGITTIPTAPSDDDICLDGYSCKYGSKLFFSGGPRLSGSIDSDNEDDLFIARYNVASYESELRLNFSSVDSLASATGEDSFVVGFSDGTTFQEIFSVQNDHKVCVYGVNDGLTCSPRAPFHVIGERAKQVDEDTADADDYGFVTILENSSTETNASILGLKFSGLESDELTDGSNFINFDTSEGTIGTIEGNNFGGIRYKTTGADYAEFLPKADTGVSFEKGDIVAVENGKISKDTSNAQQLMVISSSAAVAGNWPTQNQSDYELVAFFGQVKTKVIGNVKKGDFIVASGRNDGTGIAVSPDELTIEMRKNVVGRAWDSSSKKKVKFINTAVGFSFGAYDLTKDFEMINDIKDDVDELKDERKKILDKYDNLFEQQSDEIEKLMEELDRQLSINE